MSAQSSSTTVGVGTGGNTAEKAETGQLTLGFIPLNDCAPLVIALEQGFFRRQGLDVALSREPSWANIRDKVSYGLLDGAHMLAGMPLAASLGVDPIQRPMLTAFAMSLNGNAITVSEALYQRLAEFSGQPTPQRPCTAHALGKLIHQDQQAGRPPLRFATVFPSSTHNYLLRYWLASAGIDPDRDVRLEVIPPPRMVEHLKDGRIDGYCVGDPWNTHAVEEGVGYVLITSYEIWNNHPEKVFGVTQEWADSNPATHQAVLRALMEAAQWLESPEHRLEAAHVLARPEYLDTSETVLAAGLSGHFRYRLGEHPESIADFHVFHRYAANFPWISHAEWILTQMLRWGQINGALDIKAAAASVFRPDIYREAAASLGWAVPPEDVKWEGQHAQPWQLPTQRESIAMGADQIFDALLFNPGEPDAYLHQFRDQSQNLSVAGQAIDSN